MAGGRGAKGFSFSFKAPQAITHLKRLRECGDALAALKAALLPAERAGKMGAVLFQLPPNFRVDVERLKGFLAETSRLKMRTAFEFRHESWFAEGLGEAVYAALARATRHYVSPRVTNCRRRSAGRRIFSATDCGAAAYSEADLQDMARRFARDREQGDVYAYFMHEDAPDGPLRARAVLEALAQ